MRLHPVRYLLAHSGLQQQQLSDTLVIGDITSLLLGLPEGYPIHDGVAHGIGEIISEKDAEYELANVVHEGADPEVEELHRL